eukprot:12409912-Karenia_brevis.AAC.1
MCIRDRSLFLPPTEFVKANISEYREIVKFAPPAPVEQAVAAILGEMEKVAESGRGRRGKALKTCGRIAK